LPEVFISVNIDFVSRGGAARSARVAHNHKVAGSNPAPATKLITHKTPQGVFCYYEAMTITYEDFEKVDIRVGKIIEVADFPEARKPAYKLKINFGPEIGIKQSSVQAVGAHAKEELQDSLVCCVVNFPTKQIGPFTSEVLTLGFKNMDGSGWVLIAPTSLRCYHLPSI
jgi:tRNA-binding protein